MTKFLSTGNFIHNLANQLIPFQIAVMTPPRPQVEKVATLTGHSDCVYALEAYHTPGLFFSAGGDGMVVAWDQDRPEEGKVVARTQKSIYSLLYEPETASLLVAENFEGLHRISLKDKKEIHSSKITSGALFDLKRAGAHIIAACGDGTVVVLAASDLSTIARLSFSDQSARCLAIDPLGYWLAVGYSDQYIRLFSLRDFTLLKAWKAHENSVFTLQVLPGADRLLSAGRDARLKYWNISGASPVLENEVVAHLFAINHIAFSPDKAHFATCSMDKSIKIWNTEQFRLLKVIDKARHAGHGTSVNKLLWSSHKNQLISCSDDRSISVWKLTLNPDAL